ncbi:MAG: sodium:calcium antiporter [Nitrospirota bacterium]
MASARHLAERGGPLIWGEFLFCASVIFAAGSQLARYGDMLAEKTGMGRTWIGLILLATVTSLPELATGVSAVTLAGLPDIAAGDVLGSCVFNLMLIGMLDLFYRPEPILSRVDQGQILAAGFGILLLGIVALGMLAEARRLAGGGLLWLGVYTPVIAVLYGIAVRQVFQFEQKRMAALIKAEAEALHYRDVPAPVIYRRTAAAALLVIGAGVWLAFLGGRVADETGWGQTFVGNLLIAASTSLPEVVTVFVALKLAAPDLAIANLFGSNLFNIAILAIDDAAYLRGPLLADVSLAHLFSAVTALMMTGICITGLIYRAQRKAWVFVGWDTVALFGLYLLNAYLLFTFGRGET